MRQTHAIVILPVTLSHKLGVLQNKCMHVSSPSTTRNLLPNAKNLTFLSPIPTQKNKPLLHELPPKEGEKVASAMTQATHQAALYVALQGALLYEVPLTTGTTSFFFFLFLAMVEQKSPKNSLQSILQRVTKHPPPLKKKHAKKKKGIDQKLDFRVSVFRFPVTTPKKGEKKNGFLRQKKNVVFLFIKKPKYIYFFQLSLPLKQALRNTTKQSPAPASIPSPRSCSASPPPGKLLVDIDRWPKYVVLESPSADGSTEDTGMEETGSESSNVLRAGLGA